MRASRPNIVFILADDLGWADLSVYGQTHFTTPRLDELAEHGIRFTQAYANSAVCSATRFALITGRYQYRLRGGLEEPIAGSATKTMGIPPEHPTLPSLFKEAGYTTALIGKWHLGELPRFSPMKSGYEYFFGNYSGAIDYFTHKPGVGSDLAPDLFEGDVPVERVGYYTDILADEAVDYIRRAVQDTPFFLSLHFTAPHWPWTGPEDSAISKNLTSLRHHDGGNLETYAAMVKSLDAAVGRVLDTLDERKLREDTIVIFTSDNGGERFSKTWPFVGQKTELLEGGLRVPTLLSWPQRLPPQVCHQVTMTMDWLPTLLAAAGITPDHAYPPDGDNILPVLDGSKPTYERTLFWRYKANAQRAIRQGKWKYLKIGDNEFLFDLEADVRERANVRMHHADVFERLKKLWEDWDATFLPLNSDIYSHGVASEFQADKYAPELPSPLP